jgi:hypothetical protein
LFELAEPKQRMRRDSGVVSDDSTRSSGGSEGKSGRLPLFCDRSIETPGERKQPSSL